MRKIKLNIVMKSKELLMPNYNILEESFNKILGNQDNKIGHFNKKFIILIRRMIICLLKHRNKLLKISDSFN